jgi:hypothetical protein
MKSTHNCVSRVFLVAGLACAIFVAGAASQARESSQRSDWSKESNAPGPIVVHSNYRGSGLLVVNRAADFGTQLFLSLTVDGIPVANLPWGQRFEGLLSPGHHVLTALAVPQPGVRRPSSLHVRIEPGRAYIFTAVWESDRVVLREWESWRLEDRVASNW